jgi:hypothetical protein
LCSLRQPQSECFGSKYCRESGFAARFVWYNSRRFVFTYTSTPNYPTYDVRKFGFSLDQIFERLLYKFMANYGHSRRTVGGLPPPPLLPYHRPPPDRDLSDDGAQSQLPLRIWIVPVAYSDWKLFRTDCRPGPTLSNTPKF